MKSQNWKYIPIEIGSIPLEDLESFGGIEELADYNITKGGSATKRKKEVTKKKVKTKKAKHEEVAGTNSKRIETDMSAWNSFLLHDSLIRGLSDLGFYKPTEIQTKTLPLTVKKNQDVLGAAETGSGKTLAFGLPVINKIISLKEHNSLTDGDSVKPLYCLILTPTRELAIQIKKHLQAVCKYTDILISVVVGGMAPEKQRRILKKCPEIVIATPGRLWELIGEGEEHVSKIPDVKYLVIDEADKMMERGNFTELTQIISRIKETQDKVRRQIFVFSATLTLVHDLPNRLAMKNKKIKMQKQVKLNSLVKLIGMKEPNIIDITKESAVVETLTETQIMCSNEEKDCYLYYFLAMHPGRTLVFCNSKDSVRRLRSILEYLDCHPLPIHASMQQRQRLKNLEKFEQSSSSVLLATDVASRGLDIKGIDNVIHFQVPRTAETYVHRSGRTARAANEGLSLILIDPKEIGCFKKLCKTLKKEKYLPKFPVEEKVLRAVKDRVALAHSIDNLEHKMKRQLAQNRWFLDAAKEMDIDINDENLLNDLGSKREFAVKCRKIKLLKKELNILLQKSIASSLQIGNYPTKLGKLENPLKSICQKAVTIVQKRKS